jgi:hypothetical protein
MADFVQRDRNHPSVTIWSFCVSDPAPAPAGGGDAGAAAHTVVSFYRCCLTLRTRAERTRMWSEPDRSGPAGRPWYEQLFNGPNILVRKRARIKLCYLPRTAQ